MAVYRPNNDFDYIFKVVVLGDSGVGKSNIASQFTRNDFNILSKPTIGCELGTRDVHIDEKIVKAQIWDSAGLERYQPIMSPYLQGAMGAIIVYDITNHTTFDNVENWLKILRDHTKKTNNVNVVTMLVGNKLDRVHRRKVSIEEAKTFAEREDLLFIETSALEDTNVDECFINVVNEIYNTNVNIQ